MAAYKCIACKDECKSKKTQHLFDGQPIVPCVDSRRCITSISCETWRPIVLSKWSAPLTVVQKPGQTPAFFMFSNCLYSSHNTTYIPECSWTFEIKQVKTCTGSIQLNVRVSAHNAYLYKKDWGRRAAILLAMKSAEVDDWYYAGTPFQVFRLSARTPSITMKNVGQAKDFVNPETGRIEMRINIILESAVQTLK